MKARQDVAWPVVALALTDSTMDPDMHDDGEDLKVSEFKKTMEYKLASGEVLTLESYAQQRMVRSACLSVFGTT